MRKLDLISSAFWLIFGFLICEESYRINLGSFHNPGPGFLPFGCGFVLGGLALAVMVNAMRKKSGELKDLIPPKGRIRWEKVALSLIFIVVYGLLLDFLGFLLTTFLVMGLFFRVIEPQRWRTVIAGATLTALGSYIIFQVCLEIELPRGFLGI